MDFSWKEPELSSTQARDKLYSNGFIQATLAYQKVYTEPTKPYNYLDYMTRSMNLSQIARHA